MVSKIKKYFICVLAVILALAFTFTGVVSFQADTSAYAAEPTEPATEDGSPSKPCGKGKCKAKAKGKETICDDGIDNDDDGQIDCDDNNCKKDPACQ